MPFSLNFIITYIKPVCNLFSRFSISILHIFSSCMKLFCQVSTIYWVPKAYKAEINCKFCKSLPSGLQPQYPLLPSLSHILPSFLYSHQFIPFFEGKEPKEQSSNFFAQPPRPSPASPEFYRGPPYFLYGRAPAPIFYLEGRLRPVLRPHLQP